jgi:adenosylmethionine-8-amino-7-oxononanoate aminotransferase
LRRSDGRAFDGNLRVGEMVSVMARDYQVLTRPIMDTLVVMPPLSISMDEIKTLCGGLASAIRDYRVTHDA